MNISRGFLTSGSLYLVLGILMGGWMAASGDHSLSPLHAHMNLLGFTLMMIFGLCYRLVPQLTRDWMATSHFWLHQLGALILLISLYLTLSGQISEASLAPALGIAQIALTLGAIIFALNLWKKVR